MLVKNLYRSLLLVTIFSSAALGQLPDYQLNQLQAQDGLNTSGINELARDKEGFLWLASPVKVQRFDGRYTRQFTFHESVQQFFIDNSERKWVITNNSIYKLIDINKGFTEVEFEGLSEPRIIHVYENPEGKFSAACREGHYLFNERLNKFQPYSPAIIPPGFSYSRFLGKDDSNFFYRTGDSIFQYNPKTGILKGIQLKKINRVIPLKKSDFLVSTWEFKTYYVSIENNKIDLIDTSLTGTHLILYSGILMDDKKYLFTSNKGLLEFEYGNRKFRKAVFYFNGRPLENQQTSTYLCKDHNGTVFMNHGDGIFFMNRDRSSIQYFRNYSYGNEKMPDNDVRNFSEDEKGNIWMATTNGIAHLNINSGQLKVFSPLDRENFIDFPSYRQLLDDGDYLWIGTSGNGIWILDKKSGTYKRPVFSNSPEGKITEERMNSTYVWKILKLQSGNFFVAGGGRSFLIESTSFLTRQVFFKTSGLSSRSAYQDSTGRIWHGTSRGLSCMDENFNTLFQLRDSFPDKRIASFYEVRKGVMLVGTRGLYEITVSNGHIGSLARKNGIPPDRFIYCMKKDNDGIIWMGTDDGLYRYDPEKDESILFDESDHVQSRAFNSDAAFLSRTGLMFMGGRNGVNYFYPAKVRVSTDSLIPVMTSFATSEGELITQQSTSSLKVPYANRDIEFIFTVPEFKNPFRIQYRYALEGNSEWTYTGTQNRIRINNLRPGKYELLVSASLDGKKWYDANSRMKFSVLPPWWQTWWFRLFYASGFILMVISFRNYRNKRREANEMKKTIDYFAHSGSEHSSTEDILWDIARNCISRLGFEDCVIYLLDDERKILVQKAAYGDKSPREFEIADPIEIPVGKGICGHVAATGKGIIVKDTSKDSRYIVDNAKRLSEISVPIIHDGKVIGIIDSEHTKKNFFKQTHLRTLGTIASVCSKKISTAMANEAVKKAETQLRELNTRMQESKFQNLRLQMNPHFLFNILNTIQYLIVSQQTTKASNYLNIFAGFLRSLLQYAEETVVNLSEEIRILRMYIELESLVLDESFTWEVNVSEDIDQEEVQVPFMLLQPFVENAIHHGLLQKLGEKKFRIQIEDKDDYLSCVIEDNGVGRSHAASLNGKILMPLTHESKGIEIVKQRLELMRQKTEKGAVVEIEDLFNEDKPAGTRVRLAISYYNKEEI